MDSRSGQSSLEYMMVAIFLSAALVVVFAVSFGLFSEQKISVQVAGVRSSANDLASMVNFLCTTPRNTTARTDVYIPPLVNLDQSSINNRTIKFVLKTKEAESIVAVSTTCNVTGTLPSVSGRYLFRGVSQGGEGGSVGLNYTSEIGSLRPSSG